MGMPRSRRARPGTKECRTRTCVGFISAARNAQIARRDTSCVGCSTVTQWGPSLVMMKLYVRLRGGASAVLHELRNNRGRGHKGRVTAVKFRTDSADFG